jgi:hypothetical protein
MAAAPTCIDCKIGAPDHSSDYSLISSAGWRLAQRRLPNGSISLAWRCRDCWAKHKAETGPSSGSMPLVAQPRVEAATRSSSSPASRRDTARPSERADSRRPPKSSR